jgi:hypothetical protein
MVRRSQRVRTAGVVAFAAMALIGLTACEKASAPAAVDRSPGADTPVPSSSAGRPVGAAQPSLLINQDRPFSAHEVERLSNLDGVTQLALIGYAPVWVYDQQIPTASIDPLTYRPFTPLETRNAASVWTAVTEGKALVSHAVGVRDHLPLDATVPAGWSSVRIAGLATTVPGVDMVVSSQTGERLGVPYGNGLVVAVSGDPGRATKQIRRIIGSKPTIRRITKPSATSAAPGSSGPAGPLLPAIEPSAAASPSAAPGTTPVVTPGTTPGATATATARPAHHR